MRIPVSSFDVTGSTFTGMAKLHDAGCVRTAGLGRQRGYSKVKRVSGCQIENYTG
jgi:hypothetical protein